MPSSESDLRGIHIIYIHINQCYYIEFNIGST